MQAQFLRSSVIFVLCCSILFSNLSYASSQTRGFSLADLSQGQIVDGFRAATLYLNDADEPMGARFIHARTGFTFDVLQIQSVPQGFIWVNSLPVSDRGEPHTQEHLLVGKGNKGRGVENLESMSLVASSAYTEQWRTVYDFNTAAGPQVFYQLFERKMDALLHPDYTDEEIRREVRNFGVTENPADKTLRLEEKGSVYNEMVSTFDNSSSLLFRALWIALYGEGHPLSYESGGTPEGIREIRPLDIRKFHDENYHLANMGMIGSFPKEMSLAQVLPRMDAILNRLEPRASKRAFRTAADMPRPKMAAAGQIQVVEYPDKNEQQPGSMVFAWPAALNLNSAEHALLELFLKNIAGDPTTNLYKRFVDTKTRDMDLGAKGVFSFVSNDAGQPVYMGLSDIPPANLSREKIAVVRQKILEELSGIASLKDGSPELLEFNARLKNRVIQYRRGLSKFVNSPPGFGARNTGSDWMDHLDRLNKSGTFRQSVTMKTEISFIEKLLEGKDNFWRGYIAKWRLSDATPYAVAARANPELIDREARERKARAQAEVARLKAKYGVTDDQEAIRRYRAEYDSATAELERLAKNDAPARFVDTPPMTLDDQLDYKVSALRSRVPMVASTFDNMTSSTVGLALRLNGVPEDELVYLSMLPTLLTRVGVIKDGKPLSYEEMSEMLRKEILSLNASYGTNFRTGRAELVVRGAGNDSAEAQRAVGWMNLVLLHPNWSKENLPRIRDVVDQTLSDLRRTMQAPEENWVSNPANAYRRQDNALLLTTSSFLTQAHNVHRLRWMLKDAGARENREAIFSFLSNLSDAGTHGGREDLKTLLGAMRGGNGSPAKVADALRPYYGEFARLSEPAKALAIEAAKDLDQLLTDLPDGSLPTDWSYLCQEMRHDLSISPEKTLAAMDALRQRLLKTGNARMFLIGSIAGQQKLSGSINELLANLETTKADDVKYPKERLVEARLRSRAPEAAAPVFVGLLNPNAQGGVFLNSAPGTTYQETDREALLRFLASKLYGGGGAHSIFTKTIGAGLAYNNGIGSSANNGRVTYYAERTPDLPQTLRFVIDELKKSSHDPSLVEYAIAQAFGEFRSASPYEVRGEAIAADLADGLTPEMVRRFRQSILALRHAPNLSAELYSRMDDVYARVLPGYGIKAGDVPGGVYFVIGPEKQMSSYEAYLKSVEGPSARIFRLYPRDFWMTARLSDLS
jgi:Zn-dependent M16 (insulinase) family peptidase